MKSKITKSICELDSLSLGQILDDNRSCQDVSKEIFLSKLSSLFNKFKAQGDTKLLPYSGKCCSGTCPNLGKCGYTFVGEFTKYQLSLIFEEKDGNITDIYHCNDFLSDEDLKENYELSLTFYNDERANFKPSIKYLIRVEQCSSALDELLQHASGVISKDSYCYWLMKHEELYKSFHLPPISYKTYYKFFRLYFDVKSFFDFVPFEQSLAMACDKYQELNLQDESQLLGWLVENEGLWSDLLGRSDDVDKFGNILVIKNYDLKIEASECVLVTDFLMKFESHYRPTFEKYRLTQDSDFYGQSLSSEEFNQNHSLTYHLKLRNLLNN